MLKIETRAIYLPEPVTNAPVICIDQGRIIHIGEDCAADVQAAKNFKEFDLIPGFIELQINGAFGEDFSNDPHAIWRVAARLPELGITTVLPTIITSPPEAVQEALAVWKAGPPAGYHGARIPGLHLEGPYLNPLKKGAHREQLFKTSIFSRDQQLDTRERCPNGYSGSGTAGCSFFNPRIIFKGDYCERRSLNGNYRGNESRN